MGNTLFVIWMLLYPLVRIAERYSSHIMKEEYSSEIKGFGALINIIIYFGVAILLYK